MDARYAGAGSFRRVGLLAVVLGQLQMLVDCCDGEVARWRRTSSPAGVFLDKVGHYTTEALILQSQESQAAIAYPGEAGECGGEHVFSDAGQPYNVRGLVHTRHHGGAGDVGQYTTGE